MLVVSSDAINRPPLVVTVVVGTDAANIARNYPVNVRVTAAESGLSRDTVFLCFQVRSLDPSRLATRGRRRTLSPLTLCHRTGSTAIW